MEIVETDILTASCIPNRNEQPFNITYDNSTGSRTPIIFQHEQLTEQEIELITKLLRHKKIKKCGYNISKLNYIRFERKTIDPSMPDIADYDFSFHFKHMKPFTLQFLVDRFIENDQKCLNILIWTKGYNMSFIDFGKVVVRGLTN